MIPQLRLNAHPAVILNPDVSTRIDYYDVEPGNMHPKVMLHHYEYNDVIVFKTAGLALTEDDWALINAINPPPSDDNWIKKAKLKALLAPHLPNKPHVLRTLGVGEAKVGRVQELIRRVNAQLRAYVESWFPDYKILDDQSITWRFTPTESEAMHYDSYGVTANDYHNVRIFINLDDKPRLWGVGNPVDVTIKQHRDLCVPFENDHPNLFNAGLNKDLPWDQIPRHFVAFAPGNMWLVNSQTVAHEIIYGRKMIAATFACDPATMWKPEQSFVNVVKRALVR